MLKMETSDAIKDIRLMRGIIAIYKPKGPTSHDIVDQVRKITGIRKVGHAGTLDPLASGVLIIGVGREATRQLENIVKFEKEYYVVIKFGEESTTDDDEGVKTAHIIETPPTRDMVHHALKNFEGDILQTPPIYSAIKILGKTAYALARKGIIPTLTPRKVFIKTILIEHYEWPYLTLSVTCGPGVYIRALARDLGRALGTGAHIKNLERTRIGSYTKETSLSLEGLKNLNLQTNTDDHQSIRTHTSETNKN